MITDQKPCAVYQIKHRATQRLYIGITTQRPERRWRYHFTSGRSHIGAALRAYGMAAFDFEVIAQLPTVGEAKIAERIAIAVYCPVFNKTAGGDGNHGWAHTAESKRKLSAALKGRKKTQEAIQRRKASLPSHTPEMRAKISATLRGRKHSPERVAAIRKAVAWRRGTTLSAETKAKISAALKARPPRSAEHCKKLSEAQLRRRRGDS